MFVVAGDDFKVDRVLANQSLLLTAGTPSNIPFAWFLVLACNRQAWVSGGLSFLTYYLLLTPDAGIIWSGLFTAGKNCLVEP